MSKDGKVLLIVAIIATLITILGIVAMLVAPAETSTLMRVGVFATLYGAMADIVVWRVYVEFKKSNLLKKGDKHEKDISVD